MISKHFVETTRTVIPSLAQLFRVPTQNSCCHSKPSSGQCTTWVEKQSVTKISERRVFNYSIDNLLLFNTIFLVLIFIPGKLYHCIQFKVRITLIYIFW